MDADVQQALAPDEWSRKLRLVLRVATEGVLVLVEAPREDLLRRLVGRLLPHEPALHVIVDAREIASAS